MTGFGITLEIDRTWADEDFPPRLMVRAANDMFFGTASLDTGTIELAEAARILEGFPSGRGDVRQVQFGVSERVLRDGSATLRFECVDYLGHCFVQATIDSHDEFNGFQQFAIVVLPVEAAGIDRFVRELAGMASGKRSNGFLPSTTG